MDERISSLNEILGLSLSVDVVDIGANPINGKPPYHWLLDAKTARVTGFEPNPAALAELDKVKSPLETYLPYAIGDGKRHTLQVCRESGMTSLLEPNTELFDYFHGFETWGTVMERVPVDTVRLDDVAEITAIDLLKIDIQGAELMAFQNAPHLLEKCLVIQTEVEFLPLYVNQPLFSEVEMFLRWQGYVFHRFWPVLNSRIMRPLLMNNDLFGGLSQVLEADALFIRDFTHLNRLDDAKLLRMAMILHDVYQSLDVALRLLMEYDRRNASHFAEIYMAYMRDPAGANPAVPVG